MSNLRVDIGSGFYVSDSKPFANQRCVNLYVNVPQAPAISQTSLFNVEGLREVANISVFAKDRCRGGIEFQDQAYFVCGQYLYRVSKTIPVVGDPIYTAVRLGFVGGNNGRVSMAENGSEIIIVNDIGEGYLYKPAAAPAFSAITDAGFYANGTPKVATYVDRYFIVTTDQKKAIISAVGDSSNWNSLDTISAEADPDAVVAPFVHRNQLYLLGSETTEQFQNIGGAGVPFRRVNGFVVPVGCSAPFSVVNVGDVVYWVGRGKNEKAAIWAFNGAAPQKVSTTAIDNQLHNLTETQINNIYSFAYSQKGNTFVHFTTPYATYVFNATNGRWHERESEITGENGIRTTKPFRVAAVVNAYNDLLVGDMQAGIIGIIDDAVVAEYGEYLISYFTTSPIENMSNSFTLPEIELLGETGVGNQSVPSPKIRMQISRDGVLWEDPRTREMGASGARRTRMIWRQNGRFSAQGALKFACSDPVRRRWYAVDLRFKAGRY